MLTPPKPPRVGDINAVERRVRATGSSRGSFLRRADIEPSLWWKWSRGDVQPKPETWARVAATLARIEAKIRKASA